MFVLFSFLQKDHPASPYPVHPLAAASDIRMARLQQDQRETNARLKQSASRLAYDRGHKARARAKNQPDWILGYAADAGGTSEMMNIS